MRTALPALALVLVACSGNAKPPAPVATRTPRPTEPPCPAAKPTKPNWPKDIPAFIPRPEGAVIEKVNPASKGNVTQVRFSVPMSLNESRLFVVDRFPAAGLALSRGDYEPGTEMDIPFQRNVALRGLVRVFATRERCTTLWLLAVVIDTDAPYDIGYTPPPSSTPLPFG